ncbi:MAG: shikimate kinase [Calditrichaceae bacterium]|nr:shikimate kinase [Calditrichaceae bacterium]
MKQSNKRIHIFLTGFMGAGKSRIGKALAEQYGYPFYDSDDVIEETAGKAIKNIFKEDGESQFRITESSVIKKLSLLKEPAVISLGGGAVQNEKNFITIKKYGVSVYIASSPDAILNRVKHTSERPLLNVRKGKNYEARLLARITELLNKRIPTYEKSDIIINRDGLELAEIVEQMYIKIQQFRKEL